MTKKYYPLVLGALLGIGALGAPISASAANIPYLQQSPAIEVTGGPSVLFQDVAKRGDERRWDRRRHGDRFRNRRDKYRHYYDGYYYSEPWWTLTVPLEIDDDDDDGWSDDHVDWCSDRYRSYNPGNNTWLSYSGEVRECNSPF